ncbi:MAG: Xaa-Pro aminopeptidase [Gammaproteobacteria bacterium]|nr:Xaa-Pro aminopeptidase [Gammaproteobacteria bacterium]
MDAKEFPKRRKRLMDLMGDDSIAIIPTSGVRVRSRDTVFPYRGDSDFLYLTGFPEPEAVAIIIPGRARGEFVLFCRERDPKQEIWDGLRAGVEGACDRYRADDAFPISDLDEILPGLLEEKERIFYTMGNDTAFDQRVLGWVNEVRRKGRAGVGAPDEFIALTHLLHEMRLYKSREEVRAMRQAARISAAAHRRAMENCRPGMMEYQLEAELLHEYLRNGARSPAYPAIVGGGANGCILHYTENSAELRSGDLVLIDAGAEYDGYASDITRTFPVNGAYSEAQRRIYELVLSAQAAAIAAVRPGNHWNDPHDAAIRVLTEGLVELGILKGRVRSLIKEQAYLQYYMHRTGHWLGMDVHDVGDYKLDGEWRVLGPGMVLTVEPGLYLQPRRGLAKKWWNIGIRIEDDVLVTADGRDVITRDAPKAIDDIESIMAGN